MTEKDLWARLFELSDQKFRDFHSRLVPTVPKEKIIGVRTPELRKLANEIIKTGCEENFLSRLPHKYYEENNIHAAIIEKTKNFDLCMSRLNSFLPYVDNWATCDMMSPSVLCKERKRFLSEIEKWISSESTYTVRFGILMLIKFFLDEHFCVSHVNTILRIDCTEYYVSMAVAWYFATALAKQYRQILPFIEKEGAIDTITRKRAIRKACESYRITEEQKKHLKSLKI